MATSPCYDTAEKILGARDNTRNLFENLEDVTNSARAERARFVLGCYIGLEPENAEDHNMEADLAGLLADIRHLVTFHSLDWKIIKARARDHFREEVAMEA